MHVAINELLCRRRELAVARIAFLFFVGALATYGTGCAEIADTGDEGGGAGGGSGGGDGGSDEEPEEEEFTGDPEFFPELIELCESDEYFDEDLTADEEEVLELVNEVRTSGAYCDDEWMPAVGTLTMEPELRCAARAHSLDMYERSFFAHVNPAGQSPRDRIGFTDYSGGGGSENIARGYRTPEAVMMGWMGSRGHCRNIMNGSHEYVGIGRYDRNWTQKFGRP